MAEIKEVLIKKVEKLPEQNKTEITEMSNNLGEVVELTPEEPEEITDG